MKFEDFDNGTGEAIRLLERDLLVNWCVGVLVAVAVSYFVDFSYAEAAIYWTVVAIGGVLFQEMRRARIDALRIERAKLYEQFRGRLMADDGA